MTTKTEILAAINASIEHWIENCEKAETGTLDMSDISDDKCALCEIYGVETFACKTTCPLAIFFYRCGDGQNPWTLVYEKVCCDKECFSECLDMLTALLFLREIVKTEDIYGN